MSKILKFLRALLFPEVPAARAVNHPEIVWEPVEFKFAVDWYLIGGEDYLRRINVPTSADNFQPDSVALTDPVRETSRKNHHYCSDHIPRAEKAMEAPLWGQLPSYGRGVCELCRREGRFRRNA
jgi:hypothetical protein